MIRDRIVVDLQDAVLFERLQTDSELNLDNAIAMARQTEAVEQQQPVVRSNTETRRTKVDTVQGVQSLQHKQITKNTSKKHTKMFSSQQNPKASTKGCTRCGKSLTHPRNQCPARKAKCHKCGYYQSMCRSSTMATIQTETVSEEPFLGTIEEITARKHSDQWMVELELNGRLK